jgi:hypothetical protein
VSLEARTPLPRRLPTRFLRPRHLRLRALRDAYLSSSGSDDDDSPDGLASLASSVNTLDLLSDSSSDTDSELERSTTLNSASVLDADLEDITYADLVGRPCPQAIPFYTAALRIIFRHLEEYSRSGHTDMFASAFWTTAVEGTPCPGADPLRGPPAPPPRPRR